MSTRTSPSHYGQVSLKDGDDRFVGAAALERLIAFIWHRAGLDGGLLQLLT